MRKESTPAEGIPGPAARVFGQLVHQVADGPSGKDIVWELRVTRGLAQNAFSLPDGAVYVDKEMAQILGDDPGLWAAVLAHEIVHVTEHHWAKRAAFQNALKDSHRRWGLMPFGVFPVGLGSSTSAEQESELAEFSRELELDADMGSLDLMARSGFHPDFVIALYHLMEAQEGSASAEHFLASHPGWDVRESKIRKKYFAAVAEFETLWPQPSDSPGGNAPALAFMGRPKTRFNGNHKTTEISLPLHCEHATNPVEVVLLFRRLQSSKSPLGQPAGKLEQTTACTSDQTIVSFALSPARTREEVETEFYVFDSRGWLLARSQTLKIQQ